MRLTATVLLLTIAAAAQALGDDNQRGYRDCNLNRLEACQNSNQLFFGPFGKAPAKRKHEISAALEQFLRGSPATHFDGHRFDPANAAEEGFEGPDGAPEHLPTGAWLFRGFAPHASPFSAYVAFDPAGRILEVATLNTGTDKISAPTAGADYTLRIYSRGASNAEIVSKFQMWARQAVGDKSKYPGVLPPNRFIGTEVFVAKDNQWSSHWLGR